MKKYRKLLAFIFILLLIIDMAGGFIIYDMAVGRTKKDFLLENTSLQESSVPVNAQVMLSISSQQQKDWFSKDAYEEVYITSNDGLKLTGYFYKSDISANKTVILSHGYSSQGTYMAPYVQLYAEEFGYNVLIPDDRGHGMSEGNFTGFGWIDRLDYLKWIDFVIGKVGPDSEIVVHGVSMGGSTALMLSGETLPSNVKAIVSDCAYTSVKDELEYQLKQMYDLPSFPLLNTASLLTKFLAGYTFEEASSLNQVKKSKTPTLFIHGTADNFVPFYMVNQLYEACSSEKALLVVSGAGHGASFSTDPVKYTETVGQFISRYTQTGIALTSQH